MDRTYYQYIVERKHHALRRSVDWDLAAQYSAKSLAPAERMIDRFEKLTAEETVIIPAGAQICFMRTIKNLPAIFTEEEWEQIRARKTLHELGFMSNLSPNYYRAIGAGLLSLRETADEYGARAIDAIIALSDKYCEKAKELGREDLVEVLTQVPRYPARNFREALQFFRILHFSLWLEGNYHNTVGRFDRYIYPYLKKDLEAGVHTEASALALLEDFFLSFNIDSDLYVGVQQGDNGQSMMLGGMDENGEEVFNVLSELCLQASCNNLLIDPKINLRVSSKTPQEIYTKASHLTKAGLGFPQYSNDDVVIPALVKLGYEPADAANYTVAACWEFIIPFVGADIANIGALSFTGVIDEAFRTELAKSENFDAFYGKVEEIIGRRCAEICKKTDNVWFVPSPFMNVLMDCDIEKGGKYNNYGIHGTGIATAADSLAAIRKYVFEEKKLTVEENLRAVDADFAGYEELLHTLRFDAPKLGNNDPYVDEIAVSLLDSFANALEGKTNSRGGIFRAGTGSAMFYLWHADEVGATPDGRRKGEPLGTNFSVSLFAKVNGPVSVINSMTKPHFERAINGGPLTLEFHQSLFSTEESVEKVGRLVKMFVDKGGHQLQLNAVNVETLKDAQAHPERHRQLVVRIWGWSAYFVELDKEFQDQVLARQVYAI